MQRAKVIFIVLVTVGAFVWAAEQASSIGTVNRGVFDPRVKALRQEQEQVKDNPTKVREIENRIQEIYLEYDRSPGAAFNAVVLAPNDYQQPQSDGPDVVIDTGRIVATAADYEMDGTMWVAYSRQRDSSVRVVKSTDYGSTWQPVVGFWTIPHSLINRLGMVVGAGDSAFVYVGIIHPDSSGDMACVRFNRDGSNFLYFRVKRGADTINNFTMCRDYYTPYYLYICAGDEDNTQELDDFILRSTNFAKTWTTTNTFRFVSWGSLQAGAGTYLYLAGYPGFSPYRGYVNLLINKFFSAPDSWFERHVEFDTFEVADPVMAPSFVSPSESAVVWALYAHNYRNSGDRDIMYVYSTDAGNTWSPSYYLASRSDRDERYPDLKNYTSVGNPYVNASYISEASYRYVYRHWASQNDPVNWSDTLRINTNSAGTGRQIKPLLVYAPGAPGAGAGCVFVGAGLQNLYWNAPWTTGISEFNTGLKVNRFEALPNPVTSHTTFFWTGNASRLTIYDASGRQVWYCDNPASGVQWNRTDLSGKRMSAGVYFVQLKTANGVSKSTLVVK